MWLQPLSYWILAAALSAPAAGNPSVGPAMTRPTMPEPIATRQSKFSIPFRIERSNDPAWQPVEAQLYVSTDRGAHWRLYSKGPTTQKSFAFQAGGDGEFWFAIRTADRWGRVRPESIAAPNLRIVVDTKPPALKMTAKPRPDGQVSVRWEIDEPNLKPDSFRVVYRPSPTEPWQAAPLGEFSKSGEVVFWPKPGSSDIPIRVEVADMAGNPAVANAKVKVQPNAGPQPAEGSVAIAINPPIGRKYAASNDSADSSDDGPTLTGSASGEHSRAVNLKKADSFGEQTRTVNSKTFDLEYDVESVGPSGVGRVELWGTRDDGQTWRSMAVDDDNRSPLRVKVDEEGVFGFRVAVANGAGIGGRQPAAGDRPDLLICVDTTKPVARITSVEQGADAEAGQLIVSWQADDRELAARPISLSFSQNREGPWTPIAARLENTGRYAWTIDRRSPPRIYLRLEVRDEAGNVGVHVTAEPVVVDQSRPTIRIRSIRPVGME